VATFQPDGPTVTSPQAFSGDGGEARQEAGHYARPCVPSGTADTAIRGHAPIADETNAMIAVHLLRQGRVRP
jgi:hypothetical protein